MPYHYRSGGYPNWRKDKEGNPVCRKCYNRYVRDYASEAPKQKIRLLRRLYTYKGKVIYLRDTPARMGICQQCGAKGVTTNLHHYGKYDDANPLANTVELCRKCHCKETWKLGQYNTEAYRNRPRPIIKRDPKTGRILGTLKH